MSITATEITWLTTRPSLAGRRCKQIQPPRRIHLLLDDEPIPPGAFQDLPQKAPRGERGLIIYCAYVRSLITASGAARALGVKRGTAAARLERLAARGYLRPTTSRAGGRSRKGRYARVWEWAR